MGKWDKDNKGKFRGENRRPAEERELSHRPFQEHEREQKSAGLPCMKCGDPVDAREGYSVPHPWGPKRAVRQGYFHDKCLKEAEGKDAVSVQADGKIVPWEPFARLFSSRNRFSPANPDFLKNLDSARKVLYAQEGITGEVLRLGELVVATRSVLEVPVFTDQELDQIVSSGTRS
jgi:hypothetical protein